MKTVKSLLFKKYLKGKKLQVLFFYLLVGWVLVIFFFVENCNSFGAGAHKVGKEVSFWPNFDPNFTDIWKA